MQLPETQNNYEKKKKNFQQLAISNLPEMRLLFKGGKLWSKDKWRNVVEHSLTQAAAAEVMADVLALPKDEKKELIRVAFCHDWQKRLENSLMILMILKKRSGKIFNRCQPK